MFFLIFITSFLSLFMFKFFYNNIRLFIDYFFNFLVLLQVIYKKKESSYKNKLQVD
jgi:hypothetical protein